MSVFSLFKGGKFMCTVDAENIVYGTFLKEFKNCEQVTKGKSVSIEQIKSFTERAQAVISDCYFEVSEKSICSAIEHYSDIFEWRNNRISLVEIHENSLEKLEPIFTRRLPNRVSKALREIVQGV